MSSAGHGGVLGVDFGRGRNLFDWSCPRYDELRIGGARPPYDPFDRLAGTQASTVLTNPDVLAGSGGAGCATVAATSYAYDGLDRQRTRTFTPPLGLAQTTTLHYDGLGDQVTAQQRSGGDAPASTAYVLDADGAAKAVATRQPDPVVHYLTADGQGSVTTAVTAAGAVACTARFDPFGTPQSPAASDSQGVCNTGTTPNDVFYRGARRDPATGAYQFGSRTYDPAKASFLTPDSYRDAQPHADLSLGVDPLTANRYSYVNGDPVNLADPDRHSRERTRRYAPRRSRNHPAVRRRPSASATSAFQPSTDSASEVSGRRTVGSSVGRGWNTTPG
jgi:RHS repeat-associated protein